MPQQTYNIILLDPPWPYNSRSPWKKTRYGGGVHGHYPVMSIEAIASLDIASLAARDAVVLCWATGPHLENAYACMRAWGFKPIKPVLVWVKTTPKGKLYPGSGYYSQSNVEYLLLGKRGKTLRGPRGKGTGVVDAVLAPHPRELRPHPKTGKLQSFIKHSAKPAVFHELIVKLFGDRPRIELFAREQQPGWEAVGNQLPVNPRQLEEVVGIRQKAPLAKGSKASNDATHEHCVSVIPGQASIYDFLPRESEVAS